ncbi:MAG: ribonuclease H-like domain-containing protein [Desulfobacterales bacterium]|nr:ribonuclease H-like domain-containing protein [Desulfobacterales bacterium]
MNIGRVDLLRHTFMHIQGIGTTTERRLWEAGLLAWDGLDAAAAAAPGHLRGLLRAGVAESLRNADDPAWFTRRLPAGQGWRIFPEFRGVTAYLDIETTGLDRECDRITTIALYDGRTVRSYVRGRNLDEFPADVQAFKVLVTYNGKSFDQPFLERCFGIRLRQAAVDLRYVLKGLGFGGGLKGCERSLGMGRGELDGVDGFTAVRLWERYRRRGDERALETLLAYNVQDTVNLERLLVEAYNRNVAATPLAGLRLPDAATPVNPFRAHTEVLAELSDGALPTSRYGASVAP